MTIVNVACSITLRQGVGNVIVGGVGVRPFNFAYVILSTFSGGNFFGDVGESFGRIGFVCVGYVDHWRGIQQVPRSKAMEYMQVNVWSLFIVTIVVHPCMICALCVSIKRFPEDMVSVVVVHHGARWYVFGGYNTLSNFVVCAAGPVGVGHSTIVAFGSHLFSIHDQVLGNMFIHLGFAQAGSIKRSLPVLGFYIRFIGEQQANG